MTEQMTEQMAAMEVETPPPRKSAAKNIFKIIDGVNKPKTDGTMVVVDDEEEKD